MISQELLLRLAKVDPEFCQFNKEQNCFTFFNLDSLAVKAALSSNPVVSGDNLSYTISMCEVNSSVRLLLTEKLEQRIFLAAKKYKRKWAIECCINQKGIFTEDKLESLIVAYCAALEKIKVPQIEEVKEVKN